MIYQSQVQDDLSLTDHSQVQDDLLISDTHAVSLWLAETSSYIDPVLGEMKWR